ncbi:reprolysin-like metallopeptidase [Lentzea sp. NPDC051213]|uniref:InlB B-repeat-containing protein n=1 Tax=Lentzea sp. NPDC051213 TaxID=3364126 RepID=UPI00379B4F8E
MSTRSPGLPMMAAALAVAGVLLGLPAPKFSQAATGIEIIDVLALYTPKAKAAAGGAAAIKKMIDDQVNVTNRVMTNSDTNSQIRLVGTEELTGYEGVETTPREAAPVISADENVAELRDEYGADLVTVFIGKTGQGDFYGVGSMPKSLPAGEDSVDQAHTVLDVKTTPPHGLAHELGHNLGGDHDWSTSPNSRYPGSAHNHGYGSPDKDWVTTMSYQGICGGPCPAVPFYSTPDKTWHGKPVGVGQSADAENADIFARPADNASVIKASAPGAAAYRESKSANSTVLVAKSSPVEGGVVEPRVPGPYAEKARVAVRAIPAPGYTFTGWTLDGKPVPGNSPMTTVTMDAQRELVATFEENAAVPLTVTIENPEGGTLRSYPPVKAGEQEFPQGTVLSALQPIPAPGWEVVKWEITSGGQSGSSPPPIDEGISFPLFQPFEFTVEFAKTG